MTPMQMQEFFLFYQRLNEGIGAVSEEKRIAIFKSLIMDAMGSLNAPQKSEDDIYRGFMSVAAIALRIAMTHDTMKDD